VAGLLVPPEGGPLLGTWSLPDAELAFMLQRLLQSGHPVPERLGAWVARAWQRLSVQEFVRHPRPAACPPAYWWMPANAGATVPWLP
jgi:glutathione S-transferase